MAAKMTARDKTTLTLLVLMSVFLFADQRIMYAIIKELQHEYNTSVEVIGWIGSAFTLLGAFVSIFFGYFTDKVTRKQLLLITVFVGEIPCILTGVPFFTQNIESFALLRILTGIGIGGIYPISFSLISDYFAEEHRASASAWLGVAWAIGMLLGPALAGYLTNSYGWRIAFILAAAPNFPIAIIFALYAKEPERGRTEHALENLIQQGMAYKPRITPSDFKVIFANKTNLWTFLQGIPGTIPWGVLGFLMIHFLEADRGMSKEAATTVFNLLGLGTIIGSVFFAAVGQRLYNKKPKYMPLLCGTGVLIGVIFPFILVNMQVHNPTGTEMILFYALAFLGGFLVAVPAANVKAILMNVNRPEHRGSVFAVFNITDNLGQGFGPAIGGMLGGAFGYAFSMNFSIFWWIPCGLIFFMVALYITADRDALAELMKERASQMEKGKA